MIEEDPSTCPFPNGCAMVQILTEAGFWVVYDHAERSWEFHYPIDSFIDNRPGEED